MKDTRLAAAFFRAPHQTRLKAACPSRRSDCADSMDRAPARQGAERRMSHRQRRLLMDVPRQNAGKRKMVRRIVVVVVLLLAAGGITYGVSRLQPALQSVEGGAIWPDTVKRGPMLRQVHGTGSLIPEDV